MKSHVFSFTGGFPLTQDRLLHMQNGWEEGFHALCMMLGEANLQKGVILQGMEYSIVVDDVTITEGWFATKEVAGPAKLYHVAANTFSCPVGTSLPLVAVGNTTSALTYNDGSSHNAVIDRVGVSLAVSTSYTVTPGFQMFYHDMVRWNDVWRTPVYAGDFTADSASPIGYRLSAGKIVRIKGVTDDPGSTATTDTVIFTLPEGYRPAEAQVFASVNENDGSAVAVRVKANGEVSIAGDIITQSTVGCWVNVSFEVD